MKYGKSLLISLSASAAVLMMSGCDGSSSGATDPEASATVVKVERGPLLDANVSDANGTQARELGNGEYAFETTPEYPVTAVGGYIDVNRNGVIDPGEVANTLKLKAAEGEVVTVATSLAADRNVSRLLEEAFGLTRETVETKTPGEDTAVEALSNVVYAYAMEHNVSDISTLDSSELEALKEEYRQTLEAYRTDGGDAVKHEEEVMAQLHVPTLDDADAAEAQKKLEEKLKAHAEEGHSSSVAAEMPGDSEGTAASSAGEEHAGDAQGHAESSFGQMNGGEGAASSASGGMPAEHEDGAGSAMDEAQGHAESSYAGMGDGKDEAASSAGEMSGWQHSEASEGHSSSVAGMPEDHEDPAAETPESHSSSAEAHSSSADMQTEHGEASSASAAESEEHADAEHSASSAPEESGEDMTEGSESSASEAASASSESSVPEKGRMSF